MKYLRKAWGIKKRDIQKLYGYFKSNAKTRLTRNFIFDYYTDKFLEALTNDDNNEILGNLILSASKNLSV